jgi:UPF0755 protein
MELMPRAPRKKAPIRRFGFKAYAAIGCACFVVGFFAFLPAIVRLENKPPAVPPFPVTVDPIHKTIVEDPRVDAMLGTSTPLAAAVFIVNDAFLKLAAAAIDAAPYQALIGGATKAVVIKPGYRKEQVADAFGDALGWSDEQKADFVDQAATSIPTVTEGKFDAATYVVGASTTPEAVQQMISDQFNEDIASRYSSSTAALVPMDEALNIASLIEREAGSVQQMRLISGVIWNRIFSGMRLQLDATVQYAKADGTNDVWWPTVRPKDLSIKSPYNTYLHAGLPPTPIATPSVAAVLAALNPIKTDCLYYFHDNDGQIHCSATYQEHVALLKKYFGRGK